MGITDKLKKALKGSPQRSPADSPDHTPRERGHARHTGHPSGILSAQEATHDSDSDFKSIYARQSNGEAGPRETILSPEDGTTYNHLPHEARSDGDNWAKARELTNAAALKEEEARQKAAVAHDALLVIGEHQKAADREIKKHHQLQAEAEAKLAEAGDLPLAEAYIAEQRELLNKHELAAADATRQVEEYRLGFMEAEAKYKDLEPKLAEATAAVGSIETETSKIEKGRRDAERHHEDVIAEVRWIEAEHNERSEELAKLDAEADRLAALISEYEMKLRDARAQYHIIDTRLGPIRREHAHSQKRYDAVLGRPASALQSIEDHRRKEIEFHERVERSQLVVQEAQKELVARQAEAEDWRNALDAATAAAAAAEGQHKESQSRMSDLESEFAALTKQKQQAELEHDSLMSQAEEHKTQIAALQQKVASSTAEYQRLKADASDAHQQAHEFWSKAKSIGNQESGKSASLLHRLEEKLGIPAVMAPEQ